MSTFSMKTLAIATVIGGMVAGAISASAALNLPKQNENFTFNTNMKLGSTGTDVMNLQKVLNGWPQTRVSTSGAGSPGMETSYFGPATRAAANAFQRLHLTELGITAPTGNVFAGTRGLLNMAGNGSTPTTGGTLPTGCTSTSGYSPVTGASCATGTTVPPVSTGAVSVMLAATQPTGMVVQLQAGARLADFTFTGNGTVTNIELQRIGVSTDSTLTNVYLYDGNTRITDAASVVTGGYIRFNAANGLFAVNGLRTITVRADIANTTSGQSVGVKLNSVTSAGSVSTYTNVMGNTLTIANVNTASAAFGQMDTSAKTVDAGTLNYNVWSDSVSIGTRDTYLRAATFKFIGSAPKDSVANLSLYVDGAKVAGPSVVNTGNGDKLTFDLGATPFLLKSGAHTFDVRGDIVKGSSYNFYFSVENPADFLIEDSNLAGVNITPTITVSSIAGQPINTSNAKYGTVTVNSGSVTVNVDPAFNPTTITGGATNMPVAQFLLKGYGEDVKVTSLTVTPTLTSPLPLGGGLANVSLFMNGGQVGTSQNWNGSTALTYNLGSSLYIPAGTTVTLTVKADIVNSTTSAAYTGGTVSVAINGTGNAQGITSNTILNVAGSVVTGRTITIGTGAGSLARTSGFVAQTVAPNTTAVKIGSFTLQAGSSEDVLVNQASVNLTYGGVPVMTSSNISNLVLKTGSTVLGTPVGTVPTSSSSTFSFSDVTVPMNTTKTFDVYADLGSATGTVQTDMGLTTRGAVSRLSTVTSASGSGSIVSPTIASLASTVLVSSSPVAQFVVGGTTFGIATFKVKTSVGDASVRKLSFTIAGQDAISQITVNGIATAVVNGNATTTGLSIPVSTTGTDVPVTVMFSGFKNSTTGGSLTGSVSPVTLTLTYVEAQAGSGVIITNTATAASNNMVLVASKPTLTAIAMSNAQLNTGTVLLAQYTVAADANGAIAVATTSFVTSTSTGGTLNISNVKVSDDNGATAIANSNVIANVTSGVAYQIGFTTPYQISAGQSKTFSVYGTVSGGAFGTSGNTSLSTQLDTTLANFKWNDVVSSSTQVGTGLQGFPTTSYTLRN
jgi:hypothetical protein